MLISILVFVWLAAVIVQLYYWLMIVWPLESHGERRGNATDPLSVIICTNSAEASLKTLISDILAEDYAEFELIVVNDGPSPNVDILCGEFKADTRLRVINFERLSNSVAGKKAPLAEGLKQARYDWVLLTDSDCAIREGWIRSMMSHRSSRAKLVLGYSPMQMRTGLAARLSAFDTVHIALQYMGWAVRDRTYMGVGRNLLYHRDLFREAGGFKSHLDLPSGDDDLLVQVMARMTEPAICLDEESIVYSKPKDSLRDLVRQKLRHISTAGHYDPQSTRLVWLMGSSYVAFWTLLPLVLIMARGIPLLISVVAVISFWWVFHRVSRRFEATRFVPLFPVWCVLYALFLIYLGTMKALRRTPSSWN